MSDNPRPHVPKNLDRSASESFTQKDTAARNLAATRTAEDGLRQSESVETRVAQAQALIATARGDAHDARVKVEEFAAAASTESERSAADQMLAMLGAFETRFTGIESTLRKIVSAGKESDKNATRWSMAQIAISIVTFVAGVIIGYLLR